MKLLVEMDLDVIENDPAGEAARILRYWAGALPQMDLTVPAVHELLDSSYEHTVGELRLIGSGS